nr:48 kda circadian rhythm protein {internal fragment} [Aplysia californica, eye, Peptide Partial, 20 aa] [Aplysia californica]
STTVPRGDKFSVDVEVTKPG